MIKKAIIVFFVFSIIYSFILTGNSYLSLGSDTSIIGLISYSDIYRDHFSVDPILSNSSFTYIPSHIIILKALVKVTDSYLFSLKLILFFQVFLTLLTNYILFYWLFKKLSFLQVISLSFLITMTFVMLPFGDCVGFAGIDTAFPRSTFGIFTPLILLFYFFDRPINLFKKSVPNIIVLSFAAGLLVNIHAQSGIYMFTVLLIHWTIFRAKKLKNLQVILLALIIFLVTSASFLIPFILRNISSIHGFLTNEYVEYFWNQAVLRRQMLWLLKLTFIPSCVTFLIVTFIFTKNVNKNLGSKAVFSFLKTLFITAYIVDIIGALLFGYIFIGNEDLLVRPFIRTERLVFYLVELLVVFFIVNGKELLAAHNMGVDREHFYKNRKNILYKISQSFSKKQFWIIKKAMTLATENWLIYSIYVFSVVTATTLSAHLVELSQLSSQILIKGIILVVTVVVVVLPPLVSIPRKANYVFSAGLIMCLLTILYFPYSNRTTSTLKGSLVVILPLLLITLLDNRNLLRGRVFKRLLPAYLTMILIAIPAFGITKYYKAIIYRFAQTFEKKTVMKYIAELNKKIIYDPEYIDNFDELVSWVKVNTPINGSFLFFDQRYGQQFKLASKRSVIGSNNEVTMLASNSFKNKFFHDFIKVDKHRYVLENNYFSLLPGLMKKYGLDYVLLPNWKENLLQESDWFTHLFENKHFILFKLSQKGKTVGDYLAVHAMEREVEGPIYMSLNKEQPAYISYRDILISPKMKYPRGKYSVVVTASGKPDSPTEVESIFTICLIKLGEKNTTIGRFKLPADAKTFTTKEFKIDSKDVFQLYFRKETLFTQNQSLQFDGVDDCIIIPFKRPLDLPEGTLTFWQAPGFSFPPDPEQSSLASPISFYTVDGHRFEFSNRLISSEPYFWFAWGRSDAGFINIHSEFEARAWNHWAGAWKRSQDGNLHMEFYLNGKLVGRCTVPTEKVCNDSLSSLFFDRLEGGSMGSYRPFKGAIAEVRLFNKALQPVQFMENPLKEDSSYLVGHWKLLGSCDQTILDLTQNHNDGTLGNNATEGSDDPQCVKMEVPVVVPAVPGSSADWIKDVMIRKQNQIENPPRNDKM